MIKKIRHTPHLLEQAQKRKIKLELIEKTIKQPQQKMKDEDDDKRQVAQSIIVDENGKQKILRVIIQETQTEIIAITAYMSTKISKYWRQNEN